MDSERSSGHVPELVPNRKILDDGSTWESMLSAELKDVIRRHGVEATWDALLAVMAEG